MLLRCKTPRVANNSRRLVIAEHFQRITKIITVNRMTITIEL